MLASTTHTRRRALEENRACHSSVAPAVTGASLPTHSTPSRLSSISSPPPSAASETAFAHAPAKVTRTWPFRWRSRKSGSARMKDSDLVTILYGQTIVMTPRMDRLAGSQRWGPSSEMGVSDAVSRRRPRLSSSGCAGAILEREAALRRAEMLLQPSLCSSAMMTLPWHSHAVVGDAGYESCIGARWTL
jgi:hypothetical protein